MRGFRLLVLLVALAAALAAAAVLFGGDGDDDAGAAAGTATAPISPGGVPAEPCASDRPGEGTELEEDRAVQLGRRDPARFPPASPRRALAAFMDAWYDRAWDRMALWTSASWKAVTPDGADAGSLLRRRFGTYRLRGWTVLETEQRPGVARYRVLVAYRDIRPAIDRERLLLVVNREDAGGRLVTSGGRWGVFLAEAPRAEPGEAEQPPIADCAG